MPRRSLLMLALTLAATAVLAATPPAPVDRPGPEPVLALHDPRLDEPVSLGFRNGPLQAGVAVLSQEAGLPLAAASDVAGTRVTMLRGIGTSRGLLGGLQWVVAGTWVTTKGGSPYRLEYTDSDRARARAARAKAEREGMLRLRQRWERVRSWARLDEAGLEKLAKYEPAMARCLQHPLGAAALRVAANLPGALWQSLWSTGRARFSVRQLAPQIQQDVVAWAGRSAGGQDLLMSTGRMMLQIGGVPERPTIWLRGQSTNGGSVCNLCYAEGWVRQSPAARRAAALANPSPVPAHPEFKKKVTLRDPDGPGSASSGERPEGAMPLLPLVEQLAKQLSVPIVVQCDFRPRPEDDPNKDPEPDRTRRLNRAWLRDQWWLGEEIRDAPLARALDLLCADFEYAWSFRRGVLCLRHSRWYLPEEWRQHGRPLEKLEG